MEDGMGQARLRVDFDIYDRLRYEGVECGLFCNFAEFDAFADGVMVSREVSYRAQGQTYNAKYLFLDELENLLDQLAELQHDHQHPGDKRLRKVHPDEARDGALQGAKDAPEEGGTEATLGLSSVKEFLRRNWKR